MDVEEYKESGFISADRALRYLKHLTFSFIHIQDQEKQAFRKDFIGKLNELSESKTIDEETESKRIISIENEINENFEVHKKIISELETQEKTIEDVAKGEKVDAQSISELKERQKEMLAILKRLDKKSSDLKQEAKLLMPVKDLLAEKKKRMQEVETKIKQSTQKSPKQLQLEKQIGFLEQKYKQFQESGKYSEEQLKRIKDKIDMLKLKSV